MNIQVTPRGQSVVDMRAFDPDIIGTLFTRVDMSWSRDARAQFVVSQLGDLSLIRSTHSARNSRSRRLGRHIDSDDTAYLFACLPLRGGVRVHHAKGADSARQGDAVGTHHMTLVDSTQEYEIEMADEFDAIWLRIPAQTFRANMPSVADLLGRPIEVGSGIGCLAKQMMCTTLSDEANLNQRCGRLVSQSLLGFLGEVVDETLKNAASGSSRGRRLILGRAKDYIEEHLQDDDLSPATIAAGTGISSRYLSDIFADEGLSPMRWVRQRRLELCRIELERRGGCQQLICEIAYSMGFTNVSSFNRAFKTHFGQSPRELIAKRKLN